MKEGRRRREGGWRCVALLCPLSRPSSSSGEQQRGSFYASVARLEGIFSPSLPLLPLFDPTVKKEFLLAPAATTIKFSFRREAIKTTQRERRRREILGIMLYDSALSLFPSRHSLKSRVCSPVYGSLFNITFFHFALSVSSGRGRNS